MITAEIAALVAGCVAASMCWLVGLAFFFNVPGRAQRWLDEQLDEALKKGPDAQ